MTSRGGLLKPWKNRDLLEFGIILIAIGLITVIAGEYLKANYWTYYEYHEIADKGPYLGLATAVIGALFVVVGGVRLRSDKTTKVETVSIPSAPIADEKTQIKYCGYCGTANPIDYAYCVKCGKKLSP
jgi:ribosomal protein L40E